MKVGNTFLLGLVCLLPFCGVSHAACTPNMSPQACLESQLTDVSNAYGNFKMRADGLTKQMEVQNSMIADLQKQLADVTTRQKELAARESYPASIAGEKSFTADLAGRIGKSTIHIDNITVSHTAAVVLSFSMAGEVTSPKALSATPKITFGKDGSVACPGSRGLNTSGTLQWIYASGACVAKLPADKTPIDYSIDIEIVIDAPTSPGTGTISGGYVAFYTGPS